MTLTGHWTYVKGAARHAESADGTCSSVSESANLPPTNGDAALYASFPSLLARLSQGADMHDDFQCRTSGDATWSIGSPVAKVVTSFGITLGMHIQSNMLCIYKNIFFDFYLKTCLSGKDLE